MSDDETETKIAELDAWPHSDKVEHLSPQAFPTEPPLPLGRS